MLNDGSEFQTLNKDESQKIGVTQMQFLDHC